MSPTVSAAVGITLFAIVYVMIWRMMTRPGPVSIHVAIEQMEAEERFGEMMRDLLDRATTPVTVEKRPGTRTRTRGA